MLVDAGNSSVEGMWKECAAFEKISKTGGGTKHYCHDGRLAGQILTWDAPRV